MTITHKISVQNTNTAGPGCSLATRYGTLQHLVRILRLGVALFGVSSVGWSYLKPVVLRGKHDEAVNYLTAFELGV